MVTLCAQLHIVQMILFLWFSYHSPLSNALESVESIIIQIRDDDLADTGNPTVSVTLWFNNAIYQLQMRRPERNMQYTFSSDDFTILGPSDCNIADTKIMIENDVTNGVFIDSFKFTTNTGAWYGIGAKCVETALDEWYANSNDYSHWLLDQPLCDSGYALLAFCVDNEMNDCGPSKQIYYFDTSKPNEFITYSRYESGANTVPQLESCAPSNQPTDSPADVPTTHTPTTSPITTAPSVSPTASPITSSQPTQSPTLPPSKRPSTSSTSAIMEPTDAMTDDETVATLTQHDTADRNEFVIVIDEAAIIWIVVCSALCFIIVIVLVMFAVFKNVAKSNEENIANAQQNDTNGNTTVTGGVKNVVTLVTASEVKHPPDRKQKAVQHVVRKESLSGSMKITDEGNPQDMVQKVVCDKPRGIICEGISDDVVSNESEGREQNEPIFVKQTTRCDDIQEQIVYDDEYDVDYIEEHCD